MHATLHDEDENHGFVGNLLGRFKRALSHHAEPAPVSHLDYFAESVNKRLKMAEHDYPKNEPIPRATLEGIYAWRSITHRPDNHEVAWSLVEKFIDVQRRSQIEQRLAAAAGTTAEPISQAKWAR